MKKTFTAPVLSPGPTLGAITRDVTGVSSSPFPD